LKEIVCLSGWAQKPSSLESIFDDREFFDVSVSSYNYLKHSSIENFFEAFSRKYQKLDCLVGWSLGGQLAVRLIAKKIIKPKLLVLIAPPFQFVKNSHIKAAMPHSSYQEFLENFKKSPDAALKKFSILAILNDANAKIIIDNLALEDASSKSLVYWLEELGRFSCFDINFENFPETLYFHGSGDMIVYPSQKDYFKERISSFTEVVVEKAGHAPHLSNVEKIRAYVDKFFRQKLY